MHETIVKQGIENNLSKDQIFALIEKARTRANKKIVAATKELYASFDEKKYLKSMNERPKFFPVPSAPAALVIQERQRKDRKDANHQS
jgi:hypothetical protein